MAMNKGQVLAKMETYRTLLVAGLISADKIKDALKEAVAKGEMKVLTQKAMEKAPAELIAFATEYGMVKVPRAQGGKGGRGEGELRKMLSQQFPDLWAKIAPGYDLVGTVFEVTMPDGKVIQKAWQPFFRTVVPKEQKVVSSGGAVTV